MLPFSGLNMETVFFSEMIRLLTSPHGAKTRKNINIFTNVKTSKSNIKLVDVYNLAMNAFENYVCSLGYMSLSTPLHDNYHLPT